MFISSKEEGKTVKNIELSEFSEFAYQVALFMNLFGFDHVLNNSDKHPDFPGGELSWLNDTQSVVTQLVCQIYKLYNHILLVD